MMCNGCGNKLPLAAVFAWGNIECEDPLNKNGVFADYTKTLCPRCQHVLKDILLSSDLSEQWDKYEWSLMGDEVYVEDYDV